MLQTPATPLRFERLLLTGAAGGLGRELRPRLKAYCNSLRLSDINTLQPEQASSGEEIVPCALQDAQAVMKLLEHEGVDMEVLDPVKNMSAAELLIQEIQEYYIMKGVFTIKST